MTKKELKTTATKIVMWLKNQPTKGFVVGVSGGVDSALVSTLCAMSGKPVHAVSMPINQAKDQHSRSLKHIEWLKKKFDNVTGYEDDLTGTYASNKMTMPFEINELADVNMRSRCRMVHLYMYANHFGCMVAGTGNKVEDYGVGFFTKYGDGGVDISPIGDLTKTEVWELAKHLGVNRAIVTAKPTDGLWGDNRGDEDQIGATYPELEWAMNEFEKQELVFEGDKPFYSDYVKIIKTWTARQKKVFNIFADRHFNNAHKMAMPPVCKVKGNCYVSNWCY